MIACKLAAMVPDRILSLALLNVTGGGFECLPRVCIYLVIAALIFSFTKHSPMTRELIMLTAHEVETVYQFAVEVDIFLIDMFNILQLDRHTLSIAVRFLRAKTPEQRAAVDLDTHYSKVQTALHSIILLSVNSASIISE